MYNLIKEKNISYYETTYGSKHDTREEAEKHQAWCDFYGTFTGEAFVSRKESVIVKINNKVELNIFLNYIKYYLEAKKVYNNYDNINYPAQIEYNFINKCIKI